MNKYNLIPIGDHCLIAMALQDLNLRTKAYPFDWVTKNEQLFDTNILYNVNLIEELMETDNIEGIVEKYIGNAFVEGNNKLNTDNQIWFPHDNETTLDEIRQKYKRRFIRLKADLEMENIFILVTRCYYINQSIFQEIVEKLLKYNSSSKIIFISGANHPYFETESYTNVIFKYIHYDITQFYQYDYTTFRPAATEFLRKELLIELNIN